MNLPPKLSLSQIVEHFHSFTPPQFGDRQVHLQLGAHMTATTFIQDVMKANNGVLSSKDSATQICVLVKWLGETEPAQIE